MEMAGWQIDNWLPQENGFHGLDNSRYIQQHILQEIGSCYTKKPWWWKLFSKSIRHWINPRIRYSSRGIWKSFGSSVSTGPKILGHYRYPSPVVIHCWFRWWIVSSSNCNFHELFPPTELDRISLRFLLCYGAHSSIRFRGYCYTYYNRAYINDSMAFKISYNHHDFANQESCFV